MQEDRSDRGRPLDTLVDGCTRCVQITVLLYHLTMNFVAPVFIVVMVTYVLIHSKWTWPVFVLYLSWMYYDWDSPKKGGYAITWIRKLKIQKFMASYFPMRLHKTADLSPNENYLIVCHPHGIMALGTYINFCTNASGVFDLFPSMKIKVCTLDLQFYLPFRREWILLHGLISCSKESLKYVLDKRHSEGNMVILVPGGAEEALDAHPNTNILTLMNRKGFVRVALETGTNLVPTYSFGETALFVQTDNPKGSRLRKWQELIKAKLGFSTPIVHGNGILISSFGYLPFRQPVNTVVGRPIKVMKNPNPSNEEVNELHKEYMDALCDLFETNKKRFGIKEDMRLIIT
ncbi:hypothetical protein AB6A40_004458 [Gnathostoma spinigerum]|uniref:Acyltransferase n=1 Tax=Gnathostoma spinigerum TaxID=75299 RepID=A0ABD6EK79_9BILA